MASDQSGVSTGLVVLFHKYIALLMPPIFGDSVVLLGNP